jgi:tight adherence protein C
VKANPSSAFLKHLNQFSLYILQKLRIIERFPLQVTKLHLKLIAYHGGSSQSMDRTVHYISQLISYMLLAFTVFTALGLMIDITIFEVGICITVLIPIALINELNQKLKRKKRFMLLELPEFINKLTLLVDAGETVQKAINRCVDYRQKEGFDTERSPLYCELIQMNNELKNNRSFQYVMEDFNKRCNVQEISIFTATVLLNYRRGGVEFVYALRELSRIIWDKRMALTRTLGEEASAKLVFPMVFIFFIVMVIVAAPAVIIMNATE